MWKMDYNKNDITLVDNKTNRVSKRQDTFFECKIVNIFLPVSFIMYFGCSKELIETILLSTHNIYFG